MDEQHSRFQMCAVMPCRCQVALPRQQQQLQAASDEGQMKRLPWHGCCSNTVIVWEFRRHEVLPGLTSFISDVQSVSFCSSAASSATLCAAALPFLAAACSLGRKAAAAEAPSACETILA
jgi:hypothetical protein